MIETQVCNNNVKHAQAWDRAPARIKVVGAVEAFSRNCAMLGYGRSPTTSDATIPVTEAFAVRGLST